jgi:hypothetical protein
VFDAPVSEWHLVLVCDGAVLDIDMFRDVLIRIGDDGDHSAFDILRTSARGVSAHLAGVVSSGIRYTTNRMYWGHDRIIARFVDAVLGRGTTPVSLDSAIEVVSVTDAILTALPSAPDPP